MSKYQIQTDSLLFKDLENSPVAYFCAEYGLNDSLPLYAGGLGVLSGDYVMEAGAQGLPFVAFGLFYHRSFATYSPQQKAKPELKLDPISGGFNLLKDSDGENIRITIPAESREIHAQVWVRVYKSAHVFLFDTNIEPNSESDKSICDYLYPAGEETKFLQELLLGLGGITLLKQLEITPGVYHLNEGHTSMAILGLLADYMENNPQESSLPRALEKIKNQVVATKHTILAVAGAYVHKDFLQKNIGKFLIEHEINFDDFFALGMSRKDANFFSTTRFLVEIAQRVNGVSILHALFEKRDHPESRLIPITNGVNRERWGAPTLSLASLSKLSDDQVWDIHAKLRQDLLDFVKAQTGVVLNPNAATLVWAKRITAYKRLDFIFNNPDRLAQILADEKNPLNIIISGNANMSDALGIALLDKTVKLTQDPRFKGRVVYVPNYSIEVAKKLVQGADIWLNTPIRGNEASGTSTMKAALNGALQFSTSDGWMEEINLQDKGWTLPTENQEPALYEILAGQILPLFYNRTNNTPIEWVKRMRLTIDVVSHHYTTRRMLEEYLNRLYFPSTKETYKLYESEQLTH